MEVLSDDLSSQRQLAIIERFEGFVNYTYPIAINIGPITQGLDWLGYRIWPTHKLLRRRSVIAAKRKITRYRRIGDTLSLTRFVASWRGHAQWANSFNLLNRLGVA